MTLVATARLARCLSLGRRGFEGAPCEIAHLLLVSSDGRQGHGGSIEPVRLEALQSSVVVGAAESQRVLGSLVAENELLVNLVTAEGSHSLRIEM